MTWIYHLNKEKRPLASIESNILGAWCIQIGWRCERLQSQGWSWQGKRQGDRQGQGQGHSKGERSQEGGTSNQGSSRHRDGHFYGRAIDLKHAACWSKSRLNIFSVYTSPTYFEWMNKIQHRLEDFEWNQHSKWKTGFRSSKENTICCGQLYITNKKSFVKVQDASRKPKPET